MRGQKSAHTPCRLRAASIVTHYKIYQGLRGYATETQLLIWKARRRGDGRRPGGQGGCQDLTNVSSAFDGKLSLMAPAREGSLLGFLLEAVPSSLIMSCCTSLALMTHSEARSSGSHWLNSLRGSCSLEQCWLWVTLRHIWVPAGW